MALNSTFNPIAPFTLTGTPSAGEVVTWDDTLQAWTNSAGTPGSGDVTASGTLTLNAIALGGGTTVVKTTTTGTGVVTLIAGNATGTGALVGSNSPTFVDDFDLGAAGVRFTGAAGVLTLLGLGAGADESLTIDLDGAGANTIAFGTGSGVTTTVWPFIQQLGGTAGVALSAADGVLTILGLGNGADESLTIDLDNAGANTIAFGTGTGATTTVWPFIQQLGGTAGVALSAANGVLTLLGLGDGADESLLIDLNTTANTIALSSGSGATVLTWAGSLEVLTSATVTSASGGTTLLTLAAADESPYILEVTNATNSRGLQMYLGDDGVSHWTGAVGWSFHTEGDNASLDLNDDGTASLFASTPVDMLGAGINTQGTFDNATATIGGHFVVKATAYWDKDEGEWDTDSVSGVLSAIAVGTFTAPKGTTSNFTGATRVISSADANNEYVIFNGRVETEIGTGFTQSVGPVGRLWGADFFLGGPIAVQPEKMLGYAMGINNHYNGSPAGAPSSGLVLYTQKGIDSNATLAAANTYALDQGIFIGGVSDVSGTPGIGWTTGIQVGGSATGIVAASKIGTVLKANDFATALDMKAGEGNDFVAIFASDDGDDATDIWTLKVLATGNAMTWTNAAALAMTLTTAGVLTPVTVQPSTSYKSVDGSTGATGTGTAASTLTIKNGLVTVIA